MKTLNKDITIHNTLQAAEVAYNAVEGNCDLLYSESYKTFYVDRSCTAKLAWPKLYKIIKSRRS